MICIDNIFDLLSTLESCYFVFPNSLDSYQSQLLLLPSARHRPRGAGPRLLANSASIVVHFAAVIFVAPLGERRGRGGVLLIAITTEKLSEVISFVDPRSSGLAESRHSCLDTEEVNTNGMIFFFSLRM